VKKNESRRSRVHQLYFMMTGINDFTLEIRPATNREVYEATHPQRGEMYQMLTFATTSPEGLSAHMIFVLPEREYLDYNVIVALIDDYLSILNPDNRDDLDLSYPINPN